MSGFEAYHGTTTTTPKTKAIRPLTRESTLPATHNLSVKSITVWQEAHNQALLILKWSKHSKNALIVRYVIALCYHFSCNRPCRSLVWEEVTHHHTKPFNKPTWSAYNINTLFTSSCSYLNTCVLIKVHVLKLEETVPNMCALEAVARPWSELFISKRFRGQNQIEWVRNPSQVKVIGARVVMKGKQGKHEIVDSNTIQVSGFYTWRNHHPKTKAMRLLTW